MQNNSNLVISQPSKVELMLSTMVKNMNYEQSTYCYINPLGFITKKYSYCALGGIAKDMGMKNIRILLYPEEVKTTIEKGLGMSDEEKTQLYKCPLCTEKRKLLAMLPHFNDTHKLGWNAISDMIKDLHKYRIKNYEKKHSIKEFFRIWVNRAFNN